MWFKNDPVGTQESTATAAGKHLTHLLVTTLLRVFAAHFNLRPGLKKYLASDQGWLNFTIGICTESRSVAVAICFREGKVNVLTRIPDDSDLVFIFASDSAVRKLLSATPTEMPPKICATGRPRAAWSPRCQAGTSGIPIFR
jgi:hypothetical protein